MRLEPPPAVHDAPVALRPIESRDVAAWYAYLSDPHVVADTSWSVAGPDDLARIVAENESPFVTSAVRYAVVDGAGAFVGSIGLPVVSWVRRTAEVAYDLSPGAMGRGIATACCRALVDWLIDVHGFVRVQATALETNHASRRVLEKCGFRYEGTCRNLKQVRGVPRDFLLFARTSAVR